MRLSVDEEHEMALYAVMFGRFKPIPFQDIFFRMKIVAEKPTIQIRAKVCLHFCFTIFFVD